MRWSHVVLRIGAVTVAAMMLGVGCTRRAAESTGDSSAAAASLAGAEWRLVELEGRPVVSGTIDRPHLRFTSDSDSLRVGGSTGCNFLSGSYEASGSTLRFGPLITTKRACVDEDVNAQEARFVGALRRTDGFAIDGPGLTLLSGAQPVARFERGERG